MLEKYYPSQEILEEVVQRVYEEEKGRRNTKDSFEDAKRAMTKSLKEIERLKKETQLDLSKEVLRLWIYHNFKALIPLSLNFFGGKFGEEWVLDKDEGVFLKKED